jgi:hypothetical protein
VILESLSTPKSRSVGLVFLVSLLANALVFSSTAHSTNHISNPKASISAVKTSSGKSAITVNLGKTFASKAIQLRQIVVKNGVRSDVVIGLVGADKNGKAVFITSRKVSVGNKFVALVNRKAAVTAIITRIPVVAKLPVSSPVVTVTPTPTPTPAPSTPAPSTPAPSTPAPSTPAPSTPAPTSPILEILKKETVGLPTVEIKVKLNGVFVNNYALVFNDIAQGSTTNGRYTIASLLLVDMSKIKIQINTSLYTDSDGNLGNW